MVHHHQYQEDLALLAETEVVEDMTWSSEVTHFKKGNELVSRRWQSLGFCDCERQVLSRYPHWKYKTPLDILTSSRTLSLEQEHPRLIVMSWSLPIVLVTYFESSISNSFQTSQRWFRGLSSTPIKLILLETRLLPWTWWWRLLRLLQMDHREGDAVTKTTCPNTELSSNSRSNQFYEGLAVSGVLSWKSTFLLFELWEWIIHGRLAELSQECFK